MKSSLMKSSMKHLSDKKVYKTLVIGCGLSGIAVAVKLMESGINDFVILEKADRPGGTWRENTYPGCGCDVPSVFYSYSFNPSAEWNYAFAKQPEIQAYIENTLEKMHLGAFLQLNTDVTETRWLEEERHWLISTNKGEYRAQFVIFATGPITEPSLPKIPGLDKFSGPVFHSARWRHDVDLTNKRVAVIGTGASAIQFVPEIQKKVSKLYVFQRTAPWVFPRPNPRMSHQVKSIRRHFPALMKLERGSIQTLLLGINYGLLHPELFEALEPLAKKLLAQWVPDPVLRKKVTPNFTIGCKRILFSNHWYSTLAKDNVSLIHGAFTRVEGNRVVAGDGSEHEVDVIIFGTGFDVLNPPIAKKIINSNGERLSDEWDQRGHEAYLGTTTRNMPNAFFMVGPNIVAYTSFISVAEWQSCYIVDAIKRADAARVEVIQLPETLLQDYNRRVQKGLEGTVWTSGNCVSYYLDKNGKNVASWPWTISKLRQQLSRFDMINYQVWRYRT